MNAIALIPAYNEAAHIGEVVRGALEHLPVLVVDDGSTDDTAAIATRAGATVISHPTNRGKGAALITGFGWALDRGCEAVITLDADGQHDPIEIPVFLAAWARGEGDLIIGYRDFKQMPLARRWANTIGTWLFSRAMGQPIRDNQSGYRLLTRRALETLQLGGGRFETEVDMIAQAVTGGLRLGWVPIQTIYRDEVSRFHPIKDTALFFRAVWRARRLKPFANTQSTTKG